MEFTLDPTLQHMLITLWYILLLIGSLIIPFAMAKLSWFNEGTPSDRRGWRVLASIILFILGCVFAWIVLETVYIEFLMHARTLPVPITK